MNCIRDVDQNVSEILLELDNLGIADNTIVIYTADHGELAGAHGLSGKGATAYREQNNVPFIIRHPHYPGNKKCSAVTSHVDIATTLLSMAGAKPTHSEVLPGKDISTLLAAPETADFDSLRPGTLFNYNMFAYLDAEFLNSVAGFFASGGNPADIAKQGFRPNLSKRGAIRSVFDGKYKFSRYFSPQQHHVPRTLEQLYAGNDLELFDLSVDPLEMTNLAFDRKANGDIMLAMNDKLNLLIEEEVGEDIGQMLPGGVDGNWALSSDIAHLRM
jgi:arylsulfatase